MKRLLCGLAALFLTGAGIVAVAGPAAAVAPGCSAAKPTRVSGTLVSYPHQYTVNAAVSIGFTDAHRKAVGGAYTVWINPSLPASGDPTKHGARTWGPVCVPANVVAASVEVYPSIRVGSVTRQTNHTYYGGAADEFDSIKPGASNTIGMRVPEAVSTSTPAAFTNTTGYAAGYIRCSSRCGAHAGKPIPIADLVVRAFPWDGGYACGIQGFAAGPDQFGGSTNPAYGDYFRINGLAGGQCGSSAQAYSFRVSCTSWCGTPRTLTVKQTVVTGSGRGLLFVF